MNFTVAVAEYIAVLLLVLITMGYMLLIFRHKSLRAHWKDSPPMATQIVSIILISTFSGAFAILWILLSFEVLDNVPENGALIIAVGYLYVSMQILYITAGLATFAQRIFILSFPLKPMRPANRIIVFSATIIGTAGALFSAIPNVIYAAWDVQPVPKACYSFNCSALLTRGTYSTGVIMALSICTVILGSVLQYVYYQFRSSNQTASTKKLNQFARYSFFLRVLFETAPFLIDTILGNTVKITIGKWLGPYGVMGCSLDFSTCTFLYYNLVVKKKHYRSKTNGIITVPSTCTR
uniref:G_PROTEIN_RECEP_F1_2 domain-containing protein n=1 Tax=Steinernema glaseri TaxID=37863 RepID=A0A1I7XX45_9BILA